MATDDVMAEELKHDKGKAIFLKLKDGRRIRGKLEDADEHMNITLSGAEEISIDDKIRPLGVALVRGDNIIIFSPS